tara:strand:- start:95 stop:496 length:402 start_codon:yes stop_codon:yes gene_type:complete
MQLGRKDIHTLIIGKKSIGVFKRCSLFLLFLVLFLFALTSPVKADEVSAEECYEYFEHILKIQSHRKMLQLGVDELMRLHENQKLPKNELDTALSVWYSTESWLKGRVDKLYDKAYEGECFSESIRTKAGDAS